MATVAEALRQAFLVVVCLLAAVSWWQWRRRREPPAGWIAAAFGGLASLFVMRRLPVPAEGSALEWLERLPVALAVAFPYFLHRFAASFAARRAWTAAVTVSTAVLVVWTFLLPGLPFDLEGQRPLWATAYLAAAVAHWILVSVLVAFDLWRAGRGQGAVARHRMRTLSIASILLSIAVMTGAGTGDAPAVDAATRLLLLASSLLFFFGFSPPRFLRALWRRPAEESVREGLQALMAATSRQQAANQVLSQAVAIVGAGSGEITSTDGSTLASIGAPGDATRDEGALIELAFSFGTLRVWCSAYAPFFGKEEVETVRSLGTLAELALVRVAYHEEQARLASIVDSSHDAIIGATLDGTITNWNAGAQALYGYTAEEVIGRPISVLVPPDHPDEVPAILERIGGGERVAQYETVRQTKSGRHVDVSLTVSSIRSGDGAIVGASSIARDISERKRMTRDLAHAHQQAVEASRLKSEFVATMSHEIRTPMNGVIGMTGLLLATDLSPAQREYAQTVRHSGEALLAVINDILDFSKIEAGRMELEVIDFSVCTAVEEVADLLSGPAHEKGLELLTVVDPQIPPVAGDPGRLRQVLVNLLGNAVKFTEEGEIAVRAELVEATGETVLVRFEVVDTGVGVPSEVRPRIFSSFTQADASTTRRYGGTGLGLAISKQLVELMGGDIGLESEVGKGTRFWFTARLETRAADEVAQPPADLARRRILVVDDNETNRVVVRELLLRWGTDPATASGPGEALRLLRGRADEGAPFDAAVLDYQMPGMNGLELARAIRADRDLNGMRLVLLSSSGTEGGPAAAREAGIDAHLTKPVREWALQRSLATALGSAAAPVEPADAPLGGGGTAPARILLVEDNTVNQRVAERMLEMLGHDVDVAANGAEAVEAVSTMPYDLVLMDVQMPVMDGLEASRRIRALGGRAGATPIVAMTAGAMEGDEEKCLAAGMDGYAAKPVRIEDLAEAVTRWASATDVGAATVRASAPAPRTDGELDVGVLEQIQELGRRKGRDLFGELSAMFFANADQQLDRLRQALSNDDYQTLAAVAHALKGSSATLGVVGVARLAHELERWALEDDLDAARDVVGRLADELPAASAALVRFARSDVER